MRKIAIISAAAITFFVMSARSFVRADTILDVSVNYSTCAIIKDNAQRLKCFDQASVASEKLLGIIPVKFTDAMMDGGKYGANLISVDGYMTCVSAELCYLGERRGSLTSNIQLDMLSMPKELRVRALRCNSFDSNCYVTVIGQLIAQIGVNIRAFNIISAPHPQ